MKSQVRSVFIQVDHNVFGSARCSGLQFDNVIIAHGSLLYFLSSNSGSIEDSDTILKNFQLIISELAQQQYFVKPEKCKGKDTFNFEVLRKDVSGLNVIQSNIDNTGYVERKISSNETFSSEDARLCLIHQFEDVIAAEISKMGFTGSQNIDYNSYECLVIPIFLFLMTGIPTKYLFEKALYALLTFIKGIQICPGLSIAVESTPFASLAFYNSLSRGIISKTLGPDQEGLLIDARLVFGCEGAPIYVFENGSKGALIGIVICIISRCDEECIGFSLGVSLKHLLNSVFGLKTSDYIPFNKLKQLNPPSFLDNELLSSAVIFVRCQHKWGSGVVVDADLGLVLTCSHIVHHAQDSVHVVFKGRTYRTFVEYASPPADPYDLAVLSVGEIPGLRSLTVAEGSPVLGNTNYANEIHQVTFRLVQLQPTERRIRVLNSGQDQGPGGLYLTNHQSCKLRTSADFLTKARTSYGAASTIMVGRSWPRSGVCSALRNEQPRITCSHGHRESIRTDAKYRTLFSKLASLSLQDGSGKCIYKPVNAPRIQDIKMNPTRQLVVTFSAHSLEEIPDIIIRLDEIIPNSSFTGESVITVGYALSTESSVIANGAPTLSSGCVAKVSLKGGPLQTTCCTQSGVSGGAVLRPPNQLIGIVVSNVRVGTSVLPIFSFAVSVDDFRTAIAQFIRTRDPNCLRSLSVKSPEVKMKWMLQDSKL